MVTKLGVDIGYSATKAAAVNDMLVQFPSFEAVPPTSKVDDLYKTKTEHLARLKHQWRPG